MGEAPKLYTNKPKKGKLELESSTTISRTLRKPIFYLFFIFFEKQKQGFLYCRQDSSAFCTCGVFAVWILIDCLWPSQIGQLKAKDFSSPLSSSSSSSMGPQSSAPSPQQPHKESFARRYKFVWPMLLAVNVAVGGPFLSLIPQLCDRVFFSFFFQFPRDVRIFVCICTKCLAVELV